MSLNDSGIFGRIDSVIQVKDHTCEICDYQGPRLAVRVGDQIFLSDSGDCEILGIVLTEMIPIAEYLKPPARR